MCCPRQMADNARKATLKTMVKEEGLKGRQVPVMGQDWGTSHVGIMHEFVKAILQAEHLGNADPEAVCCAGADASLAAGGNPLR